MDKQDFFIAHVELDKLNDLVRNISHQIGIDDPKKVVRLVNFGKYIVVKAPSSWSDKNGIIYIPWAGNEHKIKCLVVIKPDVFDDGERFIMFDEPDKCFLDNEEIFAEAERRDFKRPDIRACYDIVNFLMGSLLEDDFHEMGLSQIILMHDPNEKISSFLGFSEEELEGFPFFLSVGKSDRIGTLWHNIGHGIGCEPANDSWSQNKGEDKGFLFVVEEK